MFGGIKVFRVFGLCAMIGTRFGVVVVGNVNDGMLFGFFVMIVIVIISIVVIAISTIAITLSFNTLSRSDWRQTSERRQVRRNVRCESIEHRVGRQGWKFRR